MASLIQGNGTSTSTGSYAASNDIARFASAAEAALGLSHSTYSGTVEAARTAPSGQVARYASAAEAALGLSHSTYSGTVEAAQPPLA